MIVLILMLFYVGSLSYKLDKDKTIRNGIYDNYVLIIDTESINLYQYDSNKIIPLYSLDDIKEYDDILELKSIITNIISL